MVVAVIAVLTALGGGSIVTMLFTYLTSGRFEQRFKENKQKADDALIQYTQMQGIIHELQMRVEQVEAKLERVTSEKYELQRSVFWMLAKCTCDAARTVPLPPWIEQKENGKSQSATE